MRSRKPWSPPTDPTTANLHRIAIANLDDNERMLKRWWTKKYGQPEKPLTDYTMEELLVEHLEDFYEKNPDEIKRFEQRQGTAAADEEWDGSLPPEVEERAKRVFEHARKKRGGKKVDLEKFRSNDEVSDAEAAKIFDSIGRRLPGSGMVTEGRATMPAVIGEFEDDFGGS